MKQGEPPLRRHRCISGGFLILIFALTGCSGLPGFGLPTPYPTEYLSTVIALTVAAGRPSPVGPSASPSPSLSPNPTATLTLTGTPTRGKTPSPPAESVTPSATARRVTRTPTLTSTPPIPFAAIQIINPGPGSRVVSPIRFSAYLEPGAKGNVTIELLGEDGRMLVRNLKSYSARTRIYINLEIEFEIAAVAEAGRLLISTQDEQGRTIALDSVDLLLLSIGEEALNPPGDLLEKIVIQEPKPKALIQGGKLWVSGLARTNTEMPLVVELFTTDGKPLGGTRLVTVLESGIQDYSAYNVEFPYSIKSPTWVRLVISELAGRIPGATHQTTVEILLSP